jgi:hypothetical protein
MRKNHLIATALSALVVLSLAACRGRQANMKVAADETAAVAHLHALFSAQAAFNSSNNHFACTIAELAASPGLIDNQMSTGQADGYTFTIHCFPQIDLPAYQVWAIPVEPGQTGVNFYCTDQTGVVRRTGHLFDTCSNAKPVE